MSKDLNLCQFIGRIGKDIELKYSSASSAVVNFSIACGDDYKDKQSGQKVEQTNWVNIVAFGRLAEIIGEYCSKGSQIYISGKMRTRKWQDQSGQDRYTTEIVASEMQMLGGRAGAAEAQGVSHQGASSSPPPQAAPSPAPSMDDFDDDIPF